MQIGREKMCGRLFLQCDNAHTHQYPPTLTTPSSQHPLCYSCLTRRFALFHSSKIALFAFFMIFIIHQLAKCLAANAHHILNQLILINLKSKPSDYSIDARSYGVENREKIKASISYRNHYIHFVKKHLLLEMIL